MAFFPYTLWDLGEEILHENSSIRKLYNVGVRAVAKETNRYDPTEFVNELICFELGRLLGLPVAFGLIARRKRQPVYCSLRFTAGNPESLPSRANIPKLISDNEKIACGIVLFDSWIVNCDRHDKNIIFNQDNKQICVFDHGNALLKGQYPKDRLEEYRNDAAFGCSCIVPLLPSLKHLDLWERRLFDIPESAISRAVKDAEPFGLSQDLSDYCVQYLLERRVRLPELIRKDISPFKHLKRKLGIEDYDPRLFTISDEVASMRREVDGWLR